MDITVDDLIRLKLVHEIHTSERRSFRACRRRWDWIFRQNYYPITTAKPLEFGEAYHYAMEVYYNPERWGWDRGIMTELAIHSFVEKCEEHKVRALRLSNQSYLDPQVEEDYSERVTLGIGMLKYYCEQVAPRVDRNWKPLKVEIAFMIPVPHPDVKGSLIWCKCNSCWTKWNTYIDGLATSKSLAANEQRQPGTFGQVTMVSLGSPFKESRPNWPGLPVVYAGRLDVLAEDEHGDYWIIDWKTARSIAKDYEFLYLDDQIGSYVWAMRKLGLPVRGFVYHEQRKGFPQEPKQNKQRRLGCLYSVNKQQDVDYETYLRAIVENDYDAYMEGHYNDFLDYLKAEGIVYFDRHQIPKSQAELDEIERNIGLEALDIIDQNLRIYPSAGRFGCNFCAFRQPCMEKNAQGDYQYALNTLFEKRRHYYVREQASTESKGAE